MAADLLAYAGDFRHSYTGTDWEAVTPRFSRWLGGFSIDPDNPTRIVAGTAGWYLLTGFGELQKDSSTWISYTRWNLSGLGEEAENAEPHPASPGSTGSSPTQAVYLEAGWYVEMQIKSDTAGDYTALGTITIVELPSPKFIGNADTATANTPIELGEEEDDGDWHDLVTDPHLVTVDTTGNYLYSVVIDNDNATAATAQIMVNGTVLYAGEHNTTGGVPHGYTPLIGILALSAGDEVSISTTQTSTAPPTGVQLVLAYLDDRPCAMATSSAGTSIDAAITIMPFASETVDTDGFHDTATNNSRMTIPAAAGDGAYLMVGSVRMAGDNYVSSRIRVDGGTYPAEAQGRKTTSADAGAAMLPVIYPMYTGQYAEVEGTNDDGPFTSINNGTHFSIMYVAAFPPFTAQIYRRL